MKFTLAAFGLCVLFAVGLAQDCKPTQFECDNGKCLPLSYLCDGDDDCGDGSDEPGKERCPNCKPDQFQCENSGRCITDAWACDGDNDCRDWSDETEEACPCSDNELRCSTPTPPEGEHIKPGECIPPEWICDADKIEDCPLGDDERNCTSRATVSVSHSRRPSKPKDIKKDKQF